MDIRKTLDGSNTVFNSQFGETMHSVSGARDEALRKFVLPAGIPELAKKGSIRILDVGFGLGVNSAVAIIEARKANPKCAIDIVGLEKDEGLISEIPDFDYGFAVPSVIRAIDDGYAEMGNICISIHVGDATRTIRNLKGPYDVIFLDAFSPKVNPELWSQTFITAISNLCMSGSVLTTYSCARVVRDNLRNAGFDVRDGPVVGRRGPSTTAFYQ